MKNRRTKNAEIFQDTEELCKNNSALVRAIQNSIGKQYIIREEENISVNHEHRFLKPADIVVSKKRSLEAAGAYRDLKVCVHNFASFTNPGGGVRKGSSAQEEAICRCSTLFFNLCSGKVFKDFYCAHRELLKADILDSRYNDDCVFTPEVFVFKSDDDEPRLLPERSWYKVDVITCAAPNLRAMPSNVMNLDDGKKKIKISDKDLKELHKKRIKRILDIAKKEYEDVIVLGAFGCGAFQNSPDVVAEAMAEVIQE